MEKFSFLEKSWRTIFSGTTVVFLIVCIIGFVIYWGTEHKNERMARSLFLDLKCRIKAIQPPTDWRQGKYNGVHRAWLLQSLNDTTLFCQWDAMNDSAYFSARVGDTVHFKFIRKERFFHIKYRHEDTGHN